MRKVKIQTGPVWPLVLCPCDLLEVGLTLPLVSQP